MSPRLALLAPLTLPVAACDSEAMTDLRRNLGVGAAETEADLAGEVAAPAEPRGPVTSPLVAADRDGRRRSPRHHHGRAGDLPDRGLHRRRRRALLERADRRKHRRLPHLARGCGPRHRGEPHAFAGGVEYIGVLNGRPFVVNLRPGTCQTAWPGRLPLTARLTVTGEQRTGCAEAGTVAAPQAAAADAPATSG